MTYKDDDGKEYVSCREELEKMRKANEYDPLTRALGFKHSSDIQSSLHDYRHLITASDVKTAVNWLLSEGFDVIKPTN